MKLLYGLLGAASCLLLVVVAVPAHAQAPVPAPTLALENLIPPSSLLVPNGPGGQVQVTWRYTMPSSAQGAASYPGRTTIHWDPPPACDQDGFLIVGPPTSEVVFAPSAATNPSYTGDVNFTVKATAAAPGLRLVKCTLTAYADAAGPAQPATNVAVQLFQVVADFSGSLNAKVDTSMAEARPGSAVLFTVHLQSTANAQSKVQLSVDGDGDGWLVDLPTNLVLEPGAERDVNVVVHTPAGGLWTNSERPLTLRAWPVAALDTTKSGEAVSLDLLAKERGINVVSPSGGLALVALLAVVAGAVWFVRKRGATPPT